MHLTYKYRVYPTKQQSSELDDMLGAMCDLYNSALQERIAAYRSTANSRYELEWGTYKDKKGKEKEGYIRKHLADVKNTNSISYNQQASSLTEIRKESFISKYSCSTEQQILRRLDKAFKAFFIRLKNKDKAGFPRFQKKSRFDSVEFRVGDGLTIKKLSNKLGIVGISGEIKVKWHRELPVKPKSAVLTRTNGKWYICFQIELPDIEIREPKNPVGGDVGLLKLLTLSDGTIFENPRFYKKAEKKQQRLQRALSRCQPKSKRREKLRIKLANHARHTANQRRDHSHKISRRLIRKYDGFALDGVQIKNMVKSHIMAKSIHDAGWRQITSFTEYKAASAGFRCVKVDPRGTSQICSGCGHIPLIKKTLSVRTHMCEECGLVIDRDVNAARNILQRSGLGISPKTLTSGANKLVVLEAA